MLISLVFAGSPGSPIVPPAVGPLTVFIHCSYLTRYIWALMALHAVRGWRLQLGNRLDPFLRQLELLQLRLRVYDTRYVVDVFYNFLLLLLAKSVLLL